LAAAGPVRQTDLERTLSQYLDQMVPIQPLDIPYSRPTNVAKAIGEASDAVMSAAWRGLAKPENLIRQVWGNVEHANRVVDKANQLLAQGQEITLARYIKGFLYNPTSTTCTLSSTCSICFP
jgi:hypothetical protein